MKLQAIHEGRVYATAGRDVLVGDGSGSFTTVGRLPTGRWNRDGLESRILTSSRLTPLTTRLVGAVPTTNVWPLGDGALLATVGRSLFTSRDGGRSWEPSRRLPPSSGPMGVLPPAVTQVEGTTYLGEYPLATDVTPRILASDDRGRTWETAVALPDVRHVHAVQRDPYTGEIWVATGDTDAASRIGRLRDEHFEVVGGGSQSWRAVELAFTPESVLWGVDCGYADVNRIFRLRRLDVGDDDPPIEPVHAVGSSVYYAASLTVGGERWVAFSTAMEIGRDRTGPAEQSGEEGRGVVVAAGESSGFTEWHEVAAFERRRCLADRVTSILPRANGYIFLAADDDLGLFVNPINTATADGRICRVPSADLVRKNPTRLTASENRH